MEAVQREHEKLRASSRKAATLDAAQSIIDQLRRARESIADDPASAQITLAKLQAPVKSSFDEMTTSLKTTRGGQNNYQKALDKLFKDKPLPSSEIDALSQQSTLINRAVYLHLLREGLFGVASTMQEEAVRKANIQRDIEQTDRSDRPNEDPLGLDESLPEDMLEKFKALHNILYELRHNHNLVPAMKWTMNNGKELQSRGSNLGFELCRLQYVSILLENSHDGVLSLDSMLRAMDYAQKAFQPFQVNYSHEIQELSGAIAFFFQPEPVSIPFQAQHYLGVGRGCSLIH